MAFLFLQDGLHCRSAASQPPAVWPPELSDAAFPATNMPQVRQNEHPTGISSKIHFFYYKGIYVHSKIKNKKVSDGLVTAHASALVASKLGKISH